MRPEFIISTDHQRSLLRITLRGFFDLSAVQRFAEERNRAVDAMNCQRNSHLTVCDIREQMISSAEVEQALKTMVGDPRYTSRKLAIVATAALSRGQTRRVTDRPGVAYFADIASAEAWLFADSPDTQHHAAGGLSCFNDEEQARRQHAR